jgi:hypothetical protein
MDVSYDINLRIEKLEKQGRRLRRNCGALAAGLILVLLLLAGSQLKNGRVRAKDFSLTDTSGNVVGRMYSGVSKSCLELMGKARLADAELCVGDEYGASLSLINHRGESRAVLTAGNQLSEPTSQLVPGLVIAEADGKRVISASLGEDPQLVVGSDTRRFRLVLSLAGNEPKLRLLDGRGGILWTTP